MKRGNVIAVAAMGLILVSCTLPKLPSAPPKEKPSPAESLITTPIEFSQLPGWDNDSHALVMPAVRSSCKKLNSQPADR
ncbi:MAG: hypothetical protein OQK35_06130, partial [Alphaproteobacteria bacterium]|nr:hypothetical protein [Alphaproteobacteria bacterium]